MLNLLRSELHDNHRNLYDRAVDQWRCFVGSLLLDGAGAFYTFGGVEAHDTAMAGAGAIVTGLGLLATGFTLGQLHETSRTFAALQEDAGQQTQISAAYEI